MFAFCTPQPAPWGRKVKTREVRQRGQASTPRLLHEDLLSLPGCFSTNTSSNSTVIKHHHLIWSGSVLISYCHVGTDPKNMAGAGEEPPKAMLGGAVPHGDNACPGTPFPCMSGLAQPLTPLCFPMGLASAKQPKSQSVSFLGVVDALGHRSLSGHRQLPALPIPRMVPCPGQAPCPATKWETWSWDLCSIYH